MCHICYREYNENVLYVDLESEERSNSLGWDCYNHIQTWDWHIHIPSPDWRILTYKELNLLRPDCRVIMPLQSKSLVMIVLGC